MKHSALLALAVGVLASASSLAADPAPVVIHATPLSDIAQESVVGCMTVQKEEKKRGRKALAPVSSHCFQGLVSNDKDALSPELIEAQTIRTEIRRDVSYVQSSTTTKSETIQFSDRPSPVQSDAVTIEPAVYQDIVTITPGVISEGVRTAIKFNRTASGELIGTLALNIEELQKIERFEASASSKATPQFVDLPRRNIVTFEGNFRQPLKEIKHGAYVISLDFKVLPVGQSASEADLPVIGAP